MKPITDKQMRMVHILVKELGWTKEEYRDFLRAFSGVESVKDLTIGQASALIAELKAIHTDVTPLATPGQVKRILEHWKNIDFDRMECGDMHLHTYLRRKFGVTSVYELTKRQASGCIAAINNMEKRAKLKATQLATIREEVRIPELKPEVFTYFAPDGRATTSIAMPNGKCATFNIKIEDNGRLN